MEFEPLLEILPGKHEQLLLGVHPAVLSPELFTLFSQLQSAPLQAL